MTEPRNAATAGGASRGSQCSSAAIETLERVLGTRVRIVQKSVERGSLEIDYYSQDDLDRIYGVIAGETE